MLPNNQLSQDSVKTVRVTLSARQYQAIQGQKISGQSEHVNDLAYLFFKYTPNMIDIAYIAVQIGVTLHPHGKSMNPVIIMQSQDIKQMINKEKSRLADIDEAVNPLIGRVFFCLDKPMIGKINESDETARKKNAWMITALQQQFICFSETDAVKVQQNLQQWLRTNDSRIFTQTPYRLFDNPILGYPPRPLCRIPIDESVPDICRRIITTLDNDIRHVQREMLAAIKSDDVWYQHILSVYKIKYGSDIKPDDFNKIDFIDLLPLYQSAGLLAAAANDNNYFQRLIFVLLEMNQQIVTLGQNLTDNHKRIKGYEVEFQQLSHTFNEKVVMLVHPDLKAQMTRYMNDAFSSLENECIRNKFSFVELMVKRNEILRELNTVDLKAVTEISRLPERDNAGLFGNSFDYHKIKAYLDRNVLSPTSAASAAADPESPAAAAISRRQSS